jgi:hypothetical protein
MEKSPANPHVRFTCGDQIPVVHTELAAARTASVRSKNGIIGSVCRAALIAGWLIALTGFCYTASAKDGSFEIRSASSRLNDGVYFATARIDYRLSNDALEALNNGVALTVQLQIELSRMRRFWLDPEIATLNQGYSLSFQPVSDRYVVKNLNSGQQDSFATLFSALNNMGRVVDLPIIDASLLDPNTTYEIALRAVLDQNTLPGPLRLIAFWSSGFRLESDWYVWRLSD